MLDLVKLKYLVAVAERLSFARASEALGISQPALTRAIQSLEGQLGVRLFDRGRAGVSVTVAGREIVDHATVLLTNAADLEHELGRITSGKKGWAKFGMTPMPARTLLSLALATQLQAAPDVTNHAIVRNVDELWPLLASGEIEFVACLEGQTPESHLLRAEVIGPFPIGLIVRAGHPLLAGDHSDRRFPLLVAS